MHKELFLFISQLLTSLFTLPSPLWQLLMALLNYFENNKHLKVNMLIKKSALINYVHNGIYVFVFNSMREQNNTFLCNCCCVLFVKLFLLFWRNSIVFGCKMWDSKYSLRGEVPVRQHVQPKWWGASEAASTALMLGCQWGSTYSPRWWWGASEAARTAPGDGGVPVRQCVQSILWAASEAARTALMVGCQWGPLILQVFFYHIVVCASSVSLSLLEDRDCGRYRQQLLGCLW